MLSEQTIPSVTKRRKLEGLIDEATEGALSCEEEAMGFLYMIYEAVDTPFEAQVNGEPVTILDFATGNQGVTLQAICRSGNQKLRVNLDSIEWPTPRPEGFDWVLAYFQWRGQEQGLTIL